MSQEKLPKEAPAGGQAPGEVLDHKSMAVITNESSLKPEHCSPGSNNHLPLTPITPTSQSPMIEPSPESGIPSPPPPYTAFSPWRRRLILAIVSVAGLLGPLAGGIYLPALPILERVFGVGSTAINASVSVFMLTFAFGPLFWASCADFGGRRPLYIVSLAVYILANVLLAAVPANFGALVFLRIVQAFGSAAVVSMGAGTVADITEPKRRASAMSIFLLGPQLGPVLGPVLGGAFAGEVSWRWIFGFLAISGFTVWLTILFFLPETLRARVGNGSIYASRMTILFPPHISSSLAPESERGAPPPKPTLIAYWRMFTYPPIGIVSINTALLYSTYFAIAVQLPTDLEVVYRWSTTVVGVAFLAVGVAMMVGSVVGGRCSDWRRKRLVSKVGAENVHPEDRLTDQIWGVLLCAAGCMMYGWFVKFRVHPAGFLVATFLTGFGMSWVFIATTAFLTECVAQQAAGAFALGNMLRNPGAAVAAVVIPTLVQKMGHPWCFTGLAGLDLILVGSAVLILRVKGPMWRAQRKARMEAIKKDKP